MSELKKLIIMGSGPAGYAAAIYAARAQLTPLVFAGEKGGGQLMLTTEVENYPGFPKGIMGPMLMSEMREQAIRFGTEVIDKEVVEIDFTAKPFRINEFLAEAVIIATGAESVPLNVSGEKEYTGRGVSYCAVCDAPFFRDKRVVVVGGGDAAMEDTLALTKFAKEITVVHRRDSFRASKIMQDRVLKNEKVKVRWNSEVDEVTGNKSQVTGIKLRNNQTNKLEELAIEGVFVAIGHKPATAFLKGQVVLDEKGYVRTGMKYPSMTNIPGVFAAGDVVDFRYKQAATAAGMGVMAALDAQWWLERTV